MTTQDALERKLAIIGLGYVGLPSHGSWKNLTGMPRL